MFALGATLLLSGATAAVSATQHTLSRYCAADLKSLCGRIKPGEGRDVLQRNRTRYSTQDKVAL